MSQEVSAWPRAPLTSADLKALDSGRWKVFPRETVERIAEAWNAGMNTAAMALDLGCRPASIRMLLGAMTQRGVRLRPARDPGTPDLCVPLPPSPLAQTMGEEQFRRLSRLAEFDKAARRALDRYRRSLVA